MTFQASKTKRVTISVIVVSACLMVPALILPTLIVLYVSLGGYGPGFTAAAYGVPSFRRPDLDTHLPRSNSAKDDADLYEFIAQRHDLKRVSFESASLSDYEEEQWSKLKTQLARGI